MLSVLASLAFGAADRERRAGEVDVHDLARATDERRGYHRDDDEMRRMLVTYLSYRTALLRLAAWVQERTGEDHLCFAGGAARLRARRRLDQQCRHFP